MRHLILSLILFGIIASLAQGQAASYTWEPYDFTVTLPEGWTAVEDGDRLVMGIPDDVNRVIAGESSSGMAVAVYVVPPPLASAFSETIELSQFLRVSGNDIVIQDYGGKTLPTAELTPISGRSGRLVLVAQTFLLAASAPQVQWDALAPTLDMLIASIEARPVVVLRPPDLLQRFTWRDISFSTPVDWELTSAGSKYSIVATSHLNRLLWGQRFEMKELIVAVRDLSYLRPMLTPESLPFLEDFLYHPDHSELTAVTTLDLNGMTAASVEFNEQSVVGKAVLLLTPRRAYLFAGASSKESWAESEAALFENILHSVVIE